MINKGVKQMRLVRKIRDMSQEDVSNATQINRNTIAALESGANQFPSRRTAKVLSQYFGIPYEDFFTEVSE